MPEKSVGGGERIMREFEKLLPKKPVSGITVTELCRLAGVNRSTFYANFDDVYDLLWKTEQKMADEIYRHFLDWKTDSSVINREYLIRMLDYLKEHPSVYRAFYQGSFFLEDVPQEKDPMWNFFYLPILKRLGADENRDYTFIFFKHGFWGAVGSWIRKGCREDSGIVADMLLLGVPAPKGGTE